MGAPVLYVGRSRNASWSRLLTASGYDVLPAADLGEALPLIDRVAPYVVFVEHDGQAQRLPPIVAHAAGERAARVVAVLPRAHLAEAALAAGAHDAVPADAAAEEVRARLHGWTRSATQERQQARSLQAVSARVNALELRLEELERENRDMRELIHRDELTGLGNRRSFRLQLEYALEYAGRYGGVVSIALLDLDGMKQLNDTRGHPAGDAALRRVGEILRAALRGTDHAARLGGDEFGIVMPHTPSLAAAGVADRVRERLAAVPLSASFGVATTQVVRGVGFAADELVARADAALYAAKRAGKNRVEVDGDETTVRGAA